MNANGKMCLITGASSGLGFAAAKRFAQAGASVILVCRDHQKGAEAVREIRKETQGAYLELLVYDLASLASTWKLIEKIKAKDFTLDVLFNNAAVMKMERTQTGDGLETMFQTNYLAPFLLTNGLLNGQKLSPSARIINIAVPPQNARLDLNDLQSTHAKMPFEIFMKTKLCLLFASQELARRLENTGITVNITDPGPGPFKSNLSREAPAPVVLAQQVFAATPEKAAETIAYLAFSDEVQGKSGRLFMGMHEKPLAAYWQDRTIAQELWLKTEALIRALPQTTEMIA